MRTAVDEVAALLPSFDEPSLKARNRSPKTIRGYVESARLLAGFLSGPRDAAERGPYPS
jgi:hypothetical protein